MSLKAQLEAIIYAAETPITLEQIVQLVKDAVVADGVTDDAEIKSRVRSSVEELAAEYSAPDHGIEIRQVAGGYRMSTKPEQHEVVRAFAKSLKPPNRLSMPALETLAVIAYKQPVTVPEINEIRSVDSGGVIGTLLERKLITTAGRKQVIGRPILYKTTKEFLLRFGLKDVNELPSMEEFEKLVAEAFQGELIPAESGNGITSSAESAVADIAPEEASAEEKAG
jgi:segregation and condensation protein B